MRKLYNTVNSQNKCNRLRYCCIYFENLHFYDFCRFFAKNYCKIIKFLILQLNNIFVALYFFIAMQCRLHM
mgnify:CR=1 FL=1